MHMIEDGISFNQIYRTYGINSNLLKILWRKYQEQGSSGLRKVKNIKSDAILRKKIVLDIEQNYITLQEASLKYGPSTSRIEEWLKIARRDGIQALKAKKKQGIQSGMGRPRKNSKPLTDLEKLQKENYELKLEVVLLKKVRALVEEKNAHLRAIGQKPSKN